jgi:hypothetical protein
MCRRFLIFGSCSQLDDERYYVLKAAVAEKFEIHPNEIIVVGSTKLGFSIVPAKRYRAFGETSDIDVAIVSPQLFDRVWHESFQIPRFCEIVGRSASLCRLFCSRMGET